jgi:hypothetical protein
MVGLVSHPVIYLVTYLDRLDLRLLPFEHHHGMKDT